MGNKIVWLIFFFLTIFITVLFVKTTFDPAGDIVEYFARYRRQLTARGDIRKVSGLSDADVQRLRALHTGP